MLDIDESDLDPNYLPPLTPTPRSLISSQPQSVRSTRSTNVVSVGRQAHEKIEMPRLTLKHVSRGHREWTSSLLDCTEDRRLCWYTCFCTPVVLWNLGERLGEPNPCLSAWLPGTCSSFRTKIRTIGGIKGSVLSDCCAMACCPCCAVCQMAREIDHMIVQPEVFVRPVK